MRIVLADEACFERGLEATMTDVEFLDALHTQVCDCIDKCEETLAMLDKHDGHVPRGVRRAVKELCAAADEAVLRIVCAKKVQKPSATVHSLRPVP
jgi:hypothetical protein